MNLFTTQGEHETGELETIIKYGVGLNVRTSELQHEPWVCYFELKHSTALPLPASTLNCIFILLSKTLDLELRCHCNLETVIN